MKTTKRLKLFQGQLISPEDARVQLDLREEILKPFLVLVIGVERLKRKYKKLSAKAKQFPIRA